MDTKAKVLIAATKSLFVILDYFKSDCIALKITTRIDLNSYTHFHDKSFVNNENLEKH